MAYPLHRQLLAEAFGTFCIVFAGTGAIIVHDMNGMISHLGISLIFGLVVCVMIYLLGKLSGAHFNPAVTIGLYLAQRISGKTIAPYILSQIAGALIASIFLHLLFPAHATLGATIPAGSLAQSWIVETMLTAALMFVILTAATGISKKRIPPEMAIGGVVALAAFFAGPISGASMNPARSLGPAVVSGNTEVLWLYLTAPIFGAVIAVLICVCTKEPACCSRNSIRCKA